MTWRQQQVRTATAITVLILPAGLLVHTARADETYWIGEHTDFTKRVVPASAALGIALVLVPQLAGCESECQPHRCGPVGVVMLTVQDGETGVALPGAAVQVNEVPSSWILQGCERSGPEFGCTHEVLDVGGNEDQLRDDDDVDPGYGPWKSHATLAAAVRVAADGYSAADFVVTLQTDECGMPRPVHRIVGLVSMDQSGEARVSEAEAPGNCSDRR